MVDYKLAEKLSDLRTFLEEGSTQSIYALDTETSGLNSRRDFLAGLSLSFKEGSAIYVPLGHELGTNLDKQKVKSLLEEFLEGKRVVFFNAKFDLNFLQVGLKWVPKSFVDVMALVYLDYSDRREMGLKYLAKELLNEDMEKFDDLFTQQEIKAGLKIITRKLPQRCKNYACADADMTLRLWKMFEKHEETYKFPMDVDTKLIDVIRMVEHNGGLKLDRDYINEQILALTSRSEAIKTELHRLSGSVFDMNSNAQLGKALFEDMGLKSAGKTPKGSVYKTDEKTIEKLAETQPVLGLVILYRKMIKARDSYFKKMEKVAASGLPVRFSFNTYRVPTFRLASPGGSLEKEGTCGLNIQAVSKGEVRDIWGVDLTKEESTTSNYMDDLNEDELLFDTKSVYKRVLDKSVEDLDFTNADWVLKSGKRRICIRQDCDGCKVGCESAGLSLIRSWQKDVDIIPSVRDAFVAPEGYAIASFDYDSQELVIGANLSREPKWLNAMRQGKDLHALTASNVFGMPESDLRKDPLFSKKRALGKMMNFAVFYGATAHTLARQGDLPIATAETIFTEFKKEHPTLMMWIKQVHNFAQKNGYVTTFFGRRRRLDQFYGDFGDKKKVAFANRSAVNTAVQGTGADVSRIAMVKTANRLKKEGLSLKDARIVVQLHDELIFLINKSVLDEACRYIKEAMEFQVKEWEVQLTVGCKIGENWGDQKDYEIPS